MVRPIIVLVGLLAAATIAVVMVAPATLKSVVDDPAPVDEVPTPAVLLPNADPSPTVDDQTADVAAAVVSSEPLPTTGSVPLPLVGVTLAAGLGAEKGYAEWCEEAAEMISSAAPSHTNSGPARSHSGLHK